MTLIKFILLCIGGMLIISLPLALWAWFARAYYIVIIGVPCILTLVGGFYIWRWLYRREKARKPDRGWHYGW